MSASGIMLVVMDALVMSATRVVLMIVAAASGLLAVVAVGPAIGNIPRR